MSKTEHSPASLPVHGGNLRALAAQAGCKPEEIVDFSASLNPLGPPPWLRAEIGARIADLVHYPDPEALALREAAARRYGRPADCFLAGNGSSDLLFLCARLPGFIRAIVPQPAYADYGNAARAAGLVVEDLALDPQEGFALCFASLEAALSRGPAMVFLGQPGNPSGRTADPDRLRVLAESRPDSLFVVDEAFADFIPGLDRLAGSAPDNVLVHLSLTKIFAVAGLRLGLVAGSPERIAELSALAAPWQAGSLAQAVGARALADAAYIEASVAAVTKLRTEFARSLRGVKGLSVFPGEANFLLCRIDASGKDGEELFRFCLERRLAIRRCANYPGLDERYVRFAVRCAEDNERLLRAVAEYLEGRPRSRLRPRRTPAIMFQGAGSNAGKSVLTAGLCRLLLQEGLQPVPFKAQNMSLNSFVTEQGLEMGRAQATQAAACRLPPDARMNPVLLKPSSDTGSQVIVLGRPVENMNVSAYVRYKPTAFESVKRAYDSLSAEADVVVLEGAGSPAEINLKAHDIVNMTMARHAGARVLVAADIDRGGAYAALLGTMDCLEEWERSLVAGFVLNKFRGEKSLLAPANVELAARTGREVWGVIPYIRELGLPEEDSVSFKDRELRAPADTGGRVVDIALIDLPHISNFTDLDALGLEPDVSVRPVLDPAELGRPDALILPGSKNTLADLTFLRQRGLDAAILELAFGGACEVVGLCAGFQMLGRSIKDPHGLESASRASPGLGLLPLDTVLEPDKVLTRREAVHAPSELPVRGYEIHHGRTSGETSGLDPVVVAGDGEVLGYGLPGRRVWGTYLHGVFDADAFRRAFVDGLRTAKGLAPVGEVVAVYDLEPALDRLAAVLRRHLDLGRILRLLGLS